MATRKRTAPPVLPTDELAPPNPQKDDISNAPSLYVGIGASAGGLEALELLFKNMPADTGFTFMVVQHLSPDYKSLMVELLSKHTAMTVMRAEDGVQALPNHVYLIPPKKNMMIFHGKLYLTDQLHGHGLNLPIDIFLRSLAEDMGDRAVGIILSGTGSDGTLGIRAIKGAGGLALVQDEDTAKFDGMPRSAIATGLVDFILSPALMPARLLRFIAHPFHSTAERTDQVILQNEDAFTKILGIIRHHSGTDFTYYKPSTIIRRIERRISVNQIDNIDAYVDYLARSPHEAILLSRELLIGVTRFFRDPEAFTTIADRILPQLLDKRTKDQPIRIWSVGCSTGEEAYSLAILFLEYMEQHKITLDIKIFATDIDREAIDYASAGIYPASLVTDVTPERLRRFFSVKEDKYQINESVRRLVVFAPHNVIKDPPFSKIDFIACRNLLIYFLPVLQKKVLAMFHFALSPSGHLFLGGSETTGELADYFTSIDTKWKLYRTTPMVRPPTLNAFIAPDRREDPKPDGAPVPLAAPFRGDETTSFILSSLISAYTPPAVVVDENLDVVHVSQDVSAFIRIPTGKPNYNLMKMVLPELSIPLGMMCRKVLKSHGVGTYSDIRVPGRRTTRMVELQVRYLYETRLGRAFLIVAFIEKARVKSRPGKTSEEELTDLSAQRISDLEFDLQQSRENLQATIEELESTNEELQSTNEELIASNEELQSTNEELQSVNEELFTVNSEFQKKIEELTELNDDINNLLMNTNIGTIFLDAQLNIRKYTPAAVKVVHLLDMDIGRPIHHIGHNMRYAGFQDDVRAVVKTLRPVQNEVQLNSGEWYMINILPYRTIENAATGIVITCVDITTRKMVELQVLREQDLLRRVLDASPIGMLMIDAHADITYINARGLNLLKLKEKAVVGTPIAALPVQFQTPDRRPLSEAENPLLAAVNDPQPESHRVVLMKRGRGRALPVRITSSMIMDADNQAAGVVLGMEHLTPGDSSNRMGEAAWP